MGWRRKILNLMRKRHLDRDIERELSFHIAERTEDLSAAGVPDGEARRKALRQFGNYGLYKERTRDMDINGFLESMARNLRISVRVLAKTPGFTITGVF